MLSHEHHTMVADYHTMSQVVTDYRTEYGHHIRYRVVVERKISVDALPFQIFLKYLRVTISASFIASRKTPFFKDILINIDKGSLHSLVMFQKLHTDTIIFRTPF